MGNTRRTKKKIMTNGKTGYETQTPIPGWSWWDLFLIDALICPIGTESHLGWL